MLMSIADTIYFVNSSPFLHSSIPPPQIRNAHSSPGSITGAFWAVHCKRNAADLQEFSAIDPSIHTLFPTVSALWQDNVGIFDWLTANYRYGSYSGKITILKAYKERLGGVWRLKARKEKNIEVHTIPGTHISCRTTYVQAFAEKLRQFLN
jgi:hypothetical protein